MPMFLQNVIISLLWRQGFTETCSSCSNGHHGHCLICIRWKVVPLTRLQSLQIIQVIVIIALQLLASPLPIHTLCLPLMVSLVVVGSAILDTLVDLPRSASLVLLRLRQLEAGSLDQWLPRILCNLTRICLISIALSTIDILTAFLSLISHSFHERLGACGAQPVSEVTKFCVCHALSILVDFFGVRAPFQVLAQGGLLLLWSWLRCRRILTLSSSWVCLEKIFLLFLDHTTSTE